MKLLAGHFCLKLTFLILSIGFILSIFKNISYPLLWADESMTVIGTERVIKFDFP